VIASIKQPAPITHGPASERHIVFKLLHYAGWVDRPFPSLDCMVALALYARAIE